MMMMMKECSSAAVSHNKNVMLNLLRNPRAQAALSGLVFFGIFVLGGLRWAASIGGNGLPQLLTGITVGFMAMAAFYFCQRFRNQSRFRRAVACALMARLTLEDLRRLVPEYATDWVSFTNFEKVEWLNKELAEVWPFLDQAMSYLLKEKLQLVLDDYKMGFVESLSVKSIVVGERNPQFGGVRVLEGDADEVILEAMFSWQCEKEEVVINVKTNGPDFTLRINDIYVSDTLKLVFKPLTEELPGFGAIIVSLFEDPDMGFNIKVLGGDVKALPGVDNIIDNTIRTAVLDALVWPNRYVYPVLPGDYSNLELRPVGVLDVSLLEATNLMNTDVLGKSDPFALLFVRLKTECIKRSSTKKNSLHPVWNEGFFIEVDDPSSQSLTIRLMDEETLKNAEFIGEAKYPMKENIRCVECKEHTPYVFTLLPSNVRLCERCEYTCPKYALVTEREARGRYLLDDEDLHSLRFKKVKTKKFYVYFFLRSAVETLAHGKCTECEGREQFRRDKHKDPEIWAEVDGSSGDSNNDPDDSDTLAEDISNTMVLSEMNKNEKYLHGSVELSQDTVVQGLENAEHTFDREERKALRKEHKRQVKAENKAKRMGKKLGKCPHMEHSVAENSSKNSLLLKKIENADENLNAGDIGKVKKKHRKTKREHVSASKGVYKQEQFLGYNSQLTTKSLSDWVQERDWLESELGRNGISALELAQS